MTETGRHRRSDAARNRERVLDAARVAFAEGGVDVSMAEIARRAGVGFATAQRNFPTKSELMRAIVSEELAAMNASLASAAGLPDDASPQTLWDAVASAIATCAAHQAARPGLAGVIADSVIAAVHDAPSAHISALLDFAGASPDGRAAASGLPLGADVGPDDVLAILKANAGVIAHSAGNEEAASARFVELALRGLRR